MNLKWRKQQLGYKLRRLANKLIETDESRRDAENVRQLGRDAMAIAKAHGYDDIVQDPTEFIGSALRLADRYNIELSSGMTFGDCWAYLSEENFKKPLTEDGIDNVGYFIRPEKPEDVRAINYCRGTVQEAVCLVVVNAYKAGVLDE